MLEPVLFISFIDNIDVNIHSDSTVLKFADDTKLVARLGLRGQGAIETDSLDSKLYLNWISSIVLVTNDREEMLIV